MEYKWPVISYWKNFYVKCINISCIIILSWWSNNLSLIEAREIENISQLNKLLYINR